MVDEFEDSTQSHVERMFLQCVKPGRIAKALGLPLSEVNDRILKVQSDMAALAKMTGPDRVYALFGQLMARSQQRYNLLMVHHDRGGEELGALKAMKEEDKFVADLLARPLEAVKGMQPEDDDAPVPRTHAGLFDDGDDIVIPIEDEIMDYDVIASKATVLGRRAEAQA